MNTYLLILISVVIVIVAIYLWESIEGYENLEQSYLDSQEKYYKSRESPDIGSGSEDADKFYLFEEEKPQGHQLVMSTPDVSVGASSVDQNVKKCKYIKSCDELDGTNCGYCFYNDKFYYGNNDGPYTDVCPGGWVKTKEECEERRQRAICDKVSSCHEMVGEASICAWCPTKNKAFVYKTQDGLLVPKYPLKDSCTDDSLSGSNLGLIKQSDCTTFKQEHPCIGPNENNGPHSTECLAQLWKEAGCSVKGKSAPTQPGHDNRYWNGIGWKAAFDDMKAYKNNSDSSNYSTASKWNGQPGCLGTTPDPCDSKYNGPMECYQKIFTENGCSNKGSGYPTSKPNMSTSEYITFVKKMADQSRDSSLDYSERNAAYNKCHGGNLTAPPPLKVGDKVKYEVNVGGGYGSVCADTSDTGNLIFEGYICEKSGSSCNVLWESVTNVKTAERCGGKQMTWERSSAKSMEWVMSYLGTCKKAPSYYNGKVKATFDETELMLVSSCSESSDCQDINCNMECIIIVSNMPTVQYNVNKEDVPSVVDKVRSKYPGAVLCEKNDMQYLVNIGIPHCACGWFMENGGLTTGYPSIKGTSKGCGDGNIEVVSCGSGDRNAAVYIKVYANPDTLTSTLKDVGIAGAVITVVGKNEYNSLLANES